MKKIFGPAAVALGGLLQDGMFIASNEGDLKVAEGVLRPATESTVI